MRKEKAMHKEQLEQKPIDYHFYWQRLTELDPADVCRRTGATYDPKREGYVLPIYNLTYLILPQSEEILRMEESDRLVVEELHAHFFVMVLYYLLEAKDIKLTYNWIGEKGLEGGSIFFQGPHSLPVRELQDLHGRETEGFLQAGASLGGREIPFGDTAFSLWVFPRVRMAYVLWKGDAEFSPRLNVMFDSTILSHLSLDAIWCMVAETSRRLIGAHPASPALEAE
jgi:hypothetical protein